MSAHESKAADKGVTIQILGRDFRVSCPEGEEKQLQASVEYVNRRMKELRDTGKVTGNDWTLPELQERYQGYFSTYLARRIAALG